MIPILRTLAPYLREQRKLLIIAGAAMIGEVITALLVPWPLKFVFDSVLLKKTSLRGKLRIHVSGHALKLLIIISVAALAIALFDALFTYLDGRLSSVAAQRSIYSLRRNLFAHLQRLSVSFHHHFDTRVGDLLSRLSGDIQALQDLSASGPSNLVTNGLTLLTMIGVMFWLNWRLADLAFVATVPLFLTARGVTHQMRGALRTARRQEGRVSAVIQESLTSVKLIQAYGREKHEEARLADESTKSLSANLEAAELQARLNPYVTVLSTIATVGVTFYGVILVIGRHISPGDLLIFLGYLRGMQTPIRQLAKLSYGIGKASASMERLNELLDVSPTVIERSDAQELPRAKGSVRFEDVSFGYDPGRNVLENITLEAKPGQVIAVVGPTGAGKSTLLSLLPRFYDPTGGRVLIDGVDLRDATLTSVRAQTALVLQDSLIFRTTIRENIAYGRPEATQEEIEAAAELAGVGIIASRLDQGYDSVVSERGASLSGGEKQCIGIARALLKDAPVLILDEPTSSMDSVTERLVLDGLRTLMEGRTTFIIAHRLATVRDADVVAVMQHGRLVELGSPATLMKNKSLFAELARTQDLVLR